MARYFYRLDADAFLSPSDVNAVKENRFTSVVANNLSCVDRNT